MRKLQPLLTSLAIAPLALGQTNFSTSNFHGEFAAGSGVLRSLRNATVAGEGFDFSPSDVFHLRNNAGQYHTGDLTFRYRGGGASEWRSADSARLRRGAAEGVAGEGTLLETDLTGVLAGVDKYGIDVSRVWRELEGGDLALEFTIANRGMEGVEIGGLGMPVSAELYSDARWRMRGMFVVYFGLADMSCQ